MGYWILAQMLFKLARSWKTKSSLTWAKVNKPPTLHSEDPQEDKVVPLRIRFAMSSIEFVKSTGPVRD